MLISHELTPQLFPHFDKYNDYDFILPRFWTTNVEYKNHYLKSTKFKILDNGLFEGDSFSDEELIKIIKEVQPDIFIIPDKWNNIAETYEKANKWVQPNIKQQLPSKTNLMAVVQCTHLTYGMQLYREFLNLGIKHIAFNHSSEAYKDLFPHENILVSKMMGRIYFINYLKDTNNIDKNAYHHLLGCNYADEFKYYGKGYEFIKSLDTSNPVICGALGITYEIGGLLDKPKQKIEEFMNIDLSDKIRAISYNINKFRKYCS